MQKIPDDLTPVLVEIDDALKAEGCATSCSANTSDHKFGNRFKISLPLTKSVPTGAPNELVQTSSYSREIHNWFEDVYGERLKLDPSANAKVVICADGDIWEGPLPIIYGGLVAPSREMPDTPGDGRPHPTIYNPCAHLVGITQTRLTRFTRNDLNEVVLMYNLGLNAREAFKRFRNHDPLFSRAETDWAAATMHLTAQKPDFGQSLYSSLQMAEKFMKALIGQIGEGNPKQRHDLTKLFEELEKLICGISGLAPLLDALPDNASARYEYSSNLKEAYAAHKASLKLVGELGTVGYPDYHRSRSERR